MVFFSKKFRKLTGQDKLPFIITHSPTIFNNEWISPGQVQYFQEVTDKKIVRDVRYPHYMSLFVLVIGLICVGMLVIFFYLPYHYFDIDEPETWVLILIVTFNVFIVIFGLFLLSFAYKNLVDRKSRILEFNRESGLVTIPAKFWGKPETVPFKDVYAITSMHPSPIPNYNLSIVRSDGQPVSITLGAVVTKEQALQDWSFWVMYMDKGKLLPTSPVFDKYR